MPITTRENVLAAINHAISQQRVLLRSRSESPLPDSSVPADLDSLEDQSQSDPSNRSTNFAGDVRRQFKATKQVDYQKDDSFYTDGSGIEEDFSSGQLVYVFAQYSPSSLNHAFYFFREGESVFLIQSFAKRRVRVVQQFEFMSFLKLLCELLCNEEKKQADGLGDWKEAYKSLFFTNAQSAPPAELDGEVQRLGFRIIY